MKSWSGKVAVVTGGGSGIGQATAWLAAKRGAKVMIADINAAGAAETLKELKSRGGEGLVFNGDLSKEADAKRLAEEAKKAFGGIDHFFNIAGIMTRRATLAETTLADWQRIIDVNLTALFLTTKYAAPVMAGRNGCFVNISSLGAIYAVAYSPAYAASKAGVMGLSRSLVPLLAPMGIRVNTVLPSLVNTPFTRDATASAFTPKMDMLEGADIAGAVAWLVDHEEHNGVYISVNKTPAGAVYSMVKDPPEQTELPTQAEA